MKTATEKNKQQNVSRILKKSVNQKQEILKLSSQRRTTEKKNETEETLCGVWCNIKRNDHRITGIEKEREKIQKTYLNND